MNIPVQTHIKICSCIDNLLNGNIKDAKYQSKSFRGKHIKETCKTHYDMSERVAEVTYLFLKGKIDWQHYCEHTSDEARKFHREVVCYNVSQNQIKTNGSQKREKIEATDYRLLLDVSTEEEVCLEDKKNGKIEIWHLNDNYAGYVIEINGKGYEFVRSI